MFYIFLTIFFQRPIFRVNDNFCSHL
jgi:hypothetical protein